MQDKLGDPKRQRQRQDNMTKNKLELDTITYLEKEIAGT